MPLGKRREFTVRLTPPQADRLRAAARHTGATIQNFLHHALLEAMVTVEKELDEEKERRQRRREESRRRRPEPIGMGIGAALEKDAQERRAEREQAREVKMQPQQPPQQPQVVVVNAPAHDAEVARFAVYVVDGGPKWSQDVRLKEAVRILGSTTQSLEERVSLAKALDKTVDALARKGALSDVGSANLGNPSRPADGAGSVLDALKELFPELKKL